MTALYRRRLLRPACLALAVLVVALSIGPLAVPPHAQPASISGSRYALPAGITVVEAAGSPWEIGFALGKLLQDDIRDMTSYAHMLCSAGNPLGGSSCADGTAGLRGTLSPALLAEAEGLAAGAQVSVADILLLNLLLEVWFPPAENSLGTVGFAAWGPATTAGQALLGAGWWPADGVPLLWVVRRPNDALDTVTLGLPGWLGGIAGMNEAQVAGWVLPARTSDTSPAGLPAHLILRGALEQGAAVQEVLSWSMGQPHGSGAQLVFGGESSAVGIEWSARIQEALASDANTIFVAGLFHSPDMARIQLPALSPALFAAVQQRAETAQTSLRANSGWISREKGLGFLSSWAETEMRAGATESVAWLVLMEPAEMRIYVGAAGKTQPPAFTAFEPLSAPVPR